MEAKKVKVIKVETFDFKKANFKIELSSWNDFVDFAEIWYNEIECKDERDDERKVFFDGEYYYLISEKDLFYIHKSKAKLRK